MKKTKEFVGLANYVGFFIPGFVQHAGILTSLTKKESSYSEGELPAHALDGFELKQAFLAVPS